MIIFSSTITPRVQYVANFVGQELEGGNAQVTTDLQVYREYRGMRINYSPAKTDVQELFISPHPLLFENDIREQVIDVFDYNCNKVFFKTNGDIPFDIFAATFYLIGRYEEYLPHKKDIYGRYAHENSLAFQEKFLKFPLVNIWLLDLRKIITEKFQGIPLKKTALIFLPTYDIDIAWSYRFKGFLGTVTAIFKSIVRFDLSSLKKRIRVSRGKEKDPFDAYAWLNQVHEKYKLKPYYFFLLAKKRKGYDKNIAPNRKELTDLILDHEIRYPIGIHPSWASVDDDSLLVEEIKTLKNITGNDVRSSRQHYIRFHLPEGYQRLIENGIGFDFSMGYGSINGFRASTASPYYWYDLEKEQQTNLMLFPFCYMEANSFYEQHFSPAQALDEMRHYHQQVKNTGGVFCMIWHNSFLGTDKLYIGWKEVYEQFLKEVN